MWMIFSRMQCSSGCSIVAQDSRIQRRVGGLERLDLWSGEGMGQRMGDTRVWVPDGHNMEGLGVQGSGEALI